MKASVIIPTHNRAESLQRTLSALQGQSVRPDRFEVIVVDDGSAPDQQARVRDACARFACTPVVQSQSGRAAARNAGVARAANDILCFLDDDIEPVPEWLEQHLQSHANAARPIAVVGAVPFAGQARRDCLRWHLEAVMQFEAFARTQLPEGKLLMPPLYGNSSVRRDLFLQLGGYDETFREYGGEDIDLGYRLTQAGVTFVYNARAIGYHAFLKDFDDYCRDQQCEGRAIAQICGRYPELEPGWKIDVVSGPLRNLPLQRKVMRLVWLTLSACPVLLQPARLLIRALGGCYALRVLLHPLYRLVAQYHYALGMREGLAQRGDL